jgi:hypothetical protein
MGNGRGGFAEFLDTDAKPRGIAFIEQGRFEKRPKSCGSRTRHIQTRHAPFIEVLQPAPGNSSTGEADL